MNNKKIRLIITIMVTPLLVYSYAQDTKNPFAENSNETKNLYTAEEQTRMEGDAASEQIIGKMGPGAPGEPVPVDGYIPALLITAMGLLVYTAFRMKVVK